MTDLRPYQVQAIDDVHRAIETGRRHVLAVAPTGSGKTIVAAEIIKTAVDDGKRVLVLAHTREIIRQTSHQALQLRHRDTASSRPGLSPTPSGPCRSPAFKHYGPGLCGLSACRCRRPICSIVDECHHCPAETYRKIIAEYPNAVLLGMTATPCRGDGRGLGNIFDIIVETPQVAELIEQGFLVRTRVYAPTDPDLRGVETRQGDYVESQLAGRMDRDNLVGDIVSHWHRYGERRKTVCFAVNVAHSHPHPE